ncbi:hypothetical protein OAG35_00080 [bacterium]|nr:hypothetical protein [bacterium]
MRDEFERDTDQLDVEIGTRKRILLVFLPPYVGGLLFLWVFFRMSGTTSWLIIPFIAFTAVAIQAAAAARA